MKLASQDLSTQPLPTFKTLKEAEDYLKNNPDGLRLNIRKAPSNYGKPDRAKLAQGVYYTSGTYYLDNTNQYGVKTKLLSINLAVIYDYYTGFNTFNSVISHSSQGIRQSALASLCTWEEGSFFGWVYPDKIELDLRGKIAYKIQIMGYDFNITDVEYSLLDLISSQEIPTIADGESCNPSNSGGGSGGDGSGGDGWAGGGWAGGGSNPTPGNPIIIIIYPSDPAPTPPPAAPSPQPTPPPPGGGVE